jgi:signal peptidase I
MKFIKNIDYKKLIVPAIIIVVFIGSFFFQKYKLNNTDMESIPIQNEEVVLKKDTKLSTIKIDGIDFEFKVDVL